jgi:uncharacterized protein YjbI with pentapeptide repeats
MDIDPAAPARAQTQPTVPDQVISAEMFRAMRHAGEIRVDPKSFAGSHPVFRNLTFDLPLTFAENARYFPLGASFIEVTFKTVLDLEQALFAGPAYFWNCTFLGEVKLSKCRVEKNTDPVERRQPGEVNFSFCNFKERAHFDRAIFEGEAWFHRTIFTKGASFGGARFKEHATFDGADSDICVFAKALRDTIQPALSAAPLAAVGATGTLQSAPDVSDATYDSLIAFMRKERLLFDCADSTEHLMFGPHLKSTKGILSKLQKFVDDRRVPKLQEKRLAVQRVSQLWSRNYALSMFSDSFLNISLEQRANDMSSARFAQRFKVDEKRCDFLTHFTNVRFEKNASFHHVDLSYCMFNGCNVSDIEFFVAYWARQRYNPHGLIFRSQRNALRDELELHRKSGEAAAEAELAGRRQELSELYRELRIAYVKEGDTIVGRHFYHAELEMDRLSKGRFRRIFSMSFLFKMLAGYSVQEGLALLWLGIFLFAFYPAVYFGISTAEHAELNQPGCAPATAPVDQVLGAGSRLTRSLVSEENSLESSTFIATKEENAAIKEAAKTIQGARAEACLTSKPFRWMPSFTHWESIRRVIESLERLLVPAQIALLFICLRSRYQRLG